MTVLPLTTGIVLFVCGLVAGYLFTYREQSRDESLQIDLCEDNERLQDALEREREFALELQQANELLKGKQELLQQLCNDLQAEKEARSFDDSLSGSERTKEVAEAKELQARLAEETQRRLKTEDEYRVFKHNQLQEAADREAEFQEKLSVANSLTEKLEQELGTYRLQLEQKDQLLAAFNSRIGGFSGEKQRLEAALNQLRKDLDEQTAKLREAEQNAVALSEDKQGLTRQIEEWRNRVLEQQREIDELAEGRRRSREHDGEDNLLIASLRKRSANQERNIRRLREQAERDKTAFMQNQQQWLDAEQRLRSEIAVLTQQLERVQQNLISAKNEIADVHEDWVGDSQAIAKQAEPRLRSLLQQRDQAMLECRRMREQLDIAKINVKQNEDTIRKLRRERAAFLLKLNQSTEEKGGDLDRQAA